MADKNLLIEIDPVEQVSFSSFAKREKTLRTSEQPVICTETDDDLCLNVCEIIPSPI
jgi:hypothetical protein